ncbi:hypothetical protein Agabi119p4_103 [Agaricus bisporus var. burnettii]|uniref:Uncharacterized protein n=1 Tax=Agaricus bisporus var. burnettii TaxID=192524 RepID=A0A8H7KKF1_AGABI|nr:hypothetical protein Agabi119p4_103 [Agaricus bisporus var. burnettii]
MSSSITITYNLKPPAGIQSNGLNPSAIHEFNIPVSPNDGQKRYYTALEAAIIKAKDQIGNELTAWRDAATKRRKRKRKSRES